MNLKKLSIILSVILIVFASSTNISSARNISAPTSGNVYVNDLELIDNRMYLLIKSIIKEDFDKDQVSKDVKYLESLIKTLDDKTAKINQEDIEIALSIQAVLNYYKISIISIKKYIIDKNPDDLISSIISYSIGSNSSTNLRKFLVKAG
ncbi:hypothetical protein [Romboutsia lituseburensis]|uniref:hypothetical protein n=1 Tax=Romboutsia lituseburensis TaxID=1537 RepID=UPI0022EA5F45|nr:hypothetical protein [Romboutsia lituseburensis]